MKNNVGIIGCGKIFNRHVEAINNNDAFILKSVCDINSNIPIPSGVAYYSDYKNMIQNENINFITIATPNSLHYEQSIYSLRNGCDVLIEKPATLKASETLQIKKEAAINNQNAYCVLQVRLNPVIKTFKKMYDNGVFGSPRSISLTQRWQRPVEYFYDWRGIPNVGGGILHECGIHYLDILCYIFGLPKVHSSKTYNTKHKAQPIEDTVYSILDFDNFGGTVEILISSEPKNVECTLTLLTDKGFIKLGGKALEKIVDFDFLEKNTYDYVKQNFNDIREAMSPNSYNKYVGSCPNHPELYNKLDKFDILETYDVLRLIENMYEACGRKY